MNSQNLPWELQDAQDCDTPLEPGESFNYISFACTIVLLGFLVVLWML